MFPDILVSSSSGEMLCAVEIGYTRPEKLTAYRDMGIPDVRWYDKAGRLHTEWETRNVRAELTIAPPEITYVYTFNDVVCEHCWTAYAEPYVDGDPKEYEAADADARCATWAIVVTDYVRFWLGVFCDQCGAEYQPKQGSLSSEEVRTDLEFSTPRELANAWGRRTELLWDEAVPYFEDWGEGGLGTIRPSDGIAIDPETNDRLRTAVNLAIRRGS